MPWANLYVWTGDILHGLRRSTLALRMYLESRGVKLCNGDPRLSGSWNFYSEPKEKERIFSFKLQKSVSSLLKYFMRDVTSSLKRWCNSTAGMTLCHDPRVRYFWNMSASKSALSEYLLRTKSIHLDRRGFLLNSSEFFRGFEHVRCTQWGRCVWLCVA